MLAMHDLIADQEPIILVPHSGLTPGGTPGMNRNPPAIGGLRLLLNGIHFGLNWLIDREQRRRAQAALTAIQPAVGRALRQNPQHGVLIKLYYFRNPRLANGGIYSHLRWGTGPSPSQAESNINSVASISPVPRPGERRRVSKVFFPPRQTPVASQLSAPFATQLRCRLREGARLQNVMWGGVTGFDDERRSVPRGDLRAARFAVLRPPRSLAWFNGRFRHTTSVPVVYRQVRSGERVAVVNLDPVNPFGSVTAAMLFPLNRQALQAVRSTRRTQDTTGQLRHVVNFRLVRWARPLDIIAA